MLLEIYPWKLLKKFSFHATINPTFESICFSVWRLPKRLSFTYHNSESILYLLPFKTLSIPDNLMNWAQLKTRCSLRSSWRSKLLKHFSLHRVHNFVIFPTAFFYRLRSLQSSFDISKVGIASHNNCHFFFLDVVRSFLLRIIFVAASHQTGLDTKSIAWRPIKVRLKGRGKSGTSRDLNPPGLCCSSTH